MKKITKSFVAYLFSIVAIMFIGVSLKAIVFALNVVDKDAGYNNAYQDKEKFYGLSLERFWKVVDRVKRSHLLRKKVKMEDLELGAIDGMLRSLDRWSRVERAENEQEVGIGVGFSKKGRYPVVSSVLPGSPADNAGVKIGDIVEKINGCDMRNAEIGKAVQMTSCIKGTPIELFVLRRYPQKTSAVFTMETAVLGEQNVFWEIKNVAPGKVLSIRITEFSSKTHDQWMKMIGDVSGKDISAVVIDLRGNPGGLLDIVCKICASMLPESRKIVGLEELARPTDWYYAGNYQKANAPFWPFTGLPTVCLVGGDSCSAAEVMAACLRENLDIKLVGERTFGKGVGQEVTSGDPVKVRMTTFKWYSPLGHSFDGCGVCPDFEIERGAHGDAQFEKAVEVIGRFRAAEKCRFEKAVEKIGQALSVEYSRVSDVIRKIVQAFPASRGLIERIVKSIGQMIVVVEHYFLSK